MESRIFRRMFPVGFVTSKTFTAVSRFPLDLKVAVPYAFFRQNSANASLVLPDNMQHLECISMSRHSTKAFASASHASFGTTSLTKLEPETARNNVSTLVIDISAKYVNVSPRPCLADGFVRTIAAIHTRALNRDKTLAEETGRKGCHFPLAK